MILGVIGSKDFNDFSLLTDVLDSKTDISMIISGAAAGADTLARKYARSRKIRFEEFPPDHKNFGNEAKHVRDRMIVQCCDQLIAFRDGICEGTEFTIKYAVELKKPVESIEI
jgi:hypothetical protein